MGSPLGIPLSAVLSPLQKQEADDDSEELEIAIDNTAFMDEFFSEVTVGGHTRGWGVWESLLCPPFILIPHLAWPDRGDAAKHRQDL